MLYTGLTLIEDMHNVIFDFTHARDPEAELAKMRSAEQRPHAQESGKRDLHQGYVQLGKLLVKRDKALSELMKERAEIIAKAFKADTKPYNPPRVDEAHPVPERESQIDDLVLRDERLGEQDLQMDVDNEQEIKLEPGMFRVVECAQAHMPFAEDGFLHELPFASESYTSTSLACPSQLVGSTTEQSGSASAAQTVHKATDVLHNGDASPLLSAEMINIKYGLVPHLLQRL